MKKLIYLLQPLTVLLLVSSVGAQPIDTVRVGSPSLGGAALTEGTLVMHSFRRTEGVDTPTSTTSQYIHSSGAGPTRVYEIRTVHVSSDDTTRSSIVVRAETFELIHHRVKGRLDSAAVTVHGGYLTGWVVLPGRPIRLLDREVGYPVFPVEGQIPWLFGLLPLDAGYEAAIPHFSQWSGTEEWKRIRVVGTASLSVDEKTLECWVVDGGELFPGHNVTYWVDMDSRWVVAGVARGTEGEPEYWTRAILR